MIAKLKKTLPGAYDYYLHLSRLRQIRGINKLKNQTIEEIKTSLGLLYVEKIGHELNWDSLSTYTEKMQWEKLYDNNPLKTPLSDKYLVRDWVKEKIGEKYLIPILGVWDNFDEIDFDTLPQQFVLKTNHGSGSVMVVKNKAELNIKQSKRNFDDWMKMDFGFVYGYELHYSEIKRKIIAEKYLETERGELQDYKFLCFDGKPEFCWVDLGRFGSHTRTVFDMNWNLQPWTQAHYGISSEPIEKPENFEKMIEIATALSQGFSHVRVDLYNVSGKIYFGEMTFTNGSGLDPIVPEKYDKILGDYWKI